MGERKREGKRERDEQTKNKQRNTCREWNKPKRCPEKKKSQEIPKPRTYDFFPTARVAFIGNKKKFIRNNTCNNPKILAFYL